MNNIVNYSSSCPKFDSKTENALKEKFMNYSKRTEAIEKNQNFIPHCKAFRELISATFWVFVNQPEFILKGGIEAADFNALKFKTRKVMPHN